jgi:hypothetical protein
MRAHRGDLFVVGEDLFGQYQVGLQQRLSGAFHGNAGQTAHPSELRGERSELFVVGGPHEVQATSSSARTSGLQSFHRGQSRLYMLEDFLAHVASPLTRRNFNGGRLIGLDHRWL